MTKINMINYHFFPSYYLLQKKQNVCQITLDTLNLTGYYREGSQRLIFLRNKVSSPLATTVTCIYHMIF